MTPVQQFATTTSQRTPAGARAAFLAVRLVSLAQLLRLVSRSNEPVVRDSEVTSALDAFAREGIGRQAASLEEHVSLEQSLHMLGEVLDAIEESPMPSREWAPILDLLGEDLLSQLLGVSASSIHRYRNGDRTTPDHVAGRLHLITLVVADLTGSYNDFGIRRWFNRKRSALSGSSPLEVLTGDWEIGDASAQQVRSLATTLLAPFAA